MGYLIFALLICVCIWTVWRMVNHRRLPLNHRLDVHQKNQEDVSVSKPELKNEDDESGK